jgi:hypothetical protein
MELGAQYRRSRLIALLPLLLLVAACAGPAPTPSPSTSTPTPSAAPTVTPIPSATPTVITTPLPGPSLALLSNSGTGDMKVVNSQGVEQWGLTAAEMEQMSGETAQQVATQGQNVSPMVAGPDVLLENTPSASTGIPTTEIVVLSRTGKAIGTWAEPLGGNTEQLITSPNGTEWAWNVYSGMDKTGRQYGEVNISGLGKTVRTLFHWVAPVGFVDAAPAWTSAGIILDRVLSTTATCPPYTGTGAAAFILNPTTGALTNLISGIEQYLDADSHDTVAWEGDDEHWVVINGVIYSEFPSLVAGAFVFNGEPQVAISPDGDHVAVNRVSDNDTCNGSTPEVSIEMVSVPDQSHIDLPNLSVLGWWNDNEFVALASNQTAWLDTVQGQGVSEISADPAWSFSGVVSG